MTTTSFHAGLASPRSRGVLSRAGAAIATYLAARRQRREERLTLMELSQFDERLLRDLGIEPQDMYDAIHGRRGASALFSPMRRDGAER